MRRIFISSSSISMGRRSWGSRKRWLTDFNDSVNEVPSPAWDFTCANPVMERMDIVLFVGPLSGYGSRVATPAASSPLLESKSINCHSYNLPYVARRGDQSSWVPY